MARKKEHYEFKAQSYLRLLKYAAPYKLRLTIGIIAGFTVAGSLFGSFMLIPSIIKGVVPEGNDTKMRDEKAEAVLQAVENPSLATRQQKLEAASEALQSKKSPDIRQKVEDFKNKAKSYGITLPIVYHNNTLVLDGPVRLSVKIEDEQGKMHWQFFSIFVVGFIMLWFMKNLATYINRYCTRWVGTKVVADLRNEIFSKLLNQSLRFYGKIDVGQLISRCTNDTAAIESAVANTIADATRCPLEIIACGTAIIYFSAKNNTIALPVILFIGLPVAILPLIILGRKIRRIYRKSFANIAMVVSRMHEIFTGILIVKAYNAEEKENQIFRSVNRKYFRNVIRAIRAELLMAPSMEVVAVTATLVFLVYSYAQGVTINTLAQLMIPAFMAYQPIKQLAKIRTYAERSMAAADRYFDLIDTDTSIKEAQNPVPLDSFNSEIKFNDVVFSYGDTLILDKLNLTIKKGEVVAVVGETGSGKTTMANLIARFYDTNSGSITIDGTDVRDIEITSLRNLIGIVTQDAILFNDTIANNIA
ncbi:MAG: ABC transporter ATP-binding protein, partial [Victivallales bacterium]|nr:ABC transporter ATP-binding protein [Victivallales bacterium]